MTIASHSQQRQENDIYNFWRWPTATHDYGWISDGRTIPISISYWTWSRFAGYGIGGNNVSQCVRNITPNSAEVIAQSYLGCVFVDLQPGKYMLSFDTTERIEFRDIKYISAGNGMHRYADFTSRLMDAGHQETQIEVTDDLVTCLGFGGYNVWTALTNVRITEGVM